MQKCNRNITKMGDNLIFFKKSKIKFGDMQMIVYICKII